MKVGIHTFEKIRNITDNGSAFLRAHGLIKYWPEAEIFTYGQKYDVVIFQKAYLHEYVEGLDAIKILDLCDPDWLKQWIDVKRMTEFCDAVTCSSEGLTDYIKGITDKPVFHIPDRHDLEFVKGKKAHKGRAKAMGWFGYAHNAHCLKPVLKYVTEQDIKLNVIADRKEVVGRYLKPEDLKKINFFEYKKDTINFRLLDNDFIVLPDGMKPEWKYKSNNKTTWARCLNLPVAKHSDELLDFLEEDKRKAEADKWYAKTRKEYDVKESVKQMKDIIKEVSK